MGTYLAVQTGLYLAAVGNETLLLASMVLLSALLAASVLAGAFTESPPFRGFCLSVSVLAVFTFASLVLGGALPPTVRDLLSYLLLGSSLVFLRSPSGAAKGLHLPPRPVLLKVALVAAPTGVALGALQVLIMPQASSFSGGGGWMGVLVAGSVAFVDEYFFRGVLQRHVESETTANLGWSSVALVFAVFAAPSGNATAIAFRVGGGAVLGLLVSRTRVVLLSCVARAVAALLYGGFSAL